MNGHSHVPVKFYLHRQGLEAHTAQLMILGLNLFFILTTGFLWGFFAFTLDLEPGAIIFWVTWYPPVPVPGTE